MRNEKSKIRNLSTLISHFSFQKGFSLIEMIIVMSIIMTLLGFITINLIRSQQTASLTSTQDVLISDLRQQQLKSMIGDTEGRESYDSYGIHFDSNRYITFHGTTYSPEDSGNSIINLDNNMQLNNSGFDVIFSKLSGTISGVLTIELQDNPSSKLQRIYLNIYGTVTQVESL
ncbi:MAG: type II secretion system protein [Candidatus Levybacteria bacterium]|nr:type II secretion system protein [Candidatus Levybacteria bacterium]